MRVFRSSAVLFSVVLATAAAAVAACADGRDSGVVPPGEEPTRRTEPTEPTEGTSAPPPPTGGTPPASAPADSGGSGGSTPTGGGGAGPCETTAPSNACGLSPQCGCAAGQTCDVTNRTSGAVSCVAAGSGLIGSHCGATQDCAAGLTCAHGACRPYCKVPGDSCTGSGLGSCTASRDAAGTTVPNVNVCTIPCDLVDPSAACGSSTCVWNGSLEVTDCSSAGTKAAREPCKRAEECKPGFACVKHTVFGSECERWCRVGKEGDCGPLEMCVNVYGSKAPTQGGSPLGHCQ